MPTRLEAIDQMLGLVKEAIDAVPDLKGNILWDAKPGEVPAAPEQVNPEQPWARVVIQHGPGGQGSLSGALGKIRYDRTGLLTIQLFVPSRQGRQREAPLTATLEKATQGKTTLGGVWFRNVRSEEVGDDGAWFQTNIISEFEYDEVV